MSDLYENGMKIRREIVSSAQTLPQAEWVIRV